MGFDEEGEPLLVVSAGASKSRLACGGQSPRRAAGMPSASASAFACWRDARACPVLRAGGFFPSTVRRRASAGRRLPRRQAHVRGLGRVPERQPLARACTCRPWAFAYSRWRSARSSYDSWLLLPASCRTVDCPAAGARRSAGLTWLSSSHFSSSPGSTRIAARGPVPILMAGRAPEAIRAPCARSDAAARRPLRPSTAKLLLAKALLREE